MADAVTLPFSCPVPAKSMGKPRPIFDPENPAPAPPRRDATPADTAAAMEKSDLLQTRMGLIMDDNETSGLAILREALRVRNTKFNLANLARDVGLPTETLHAFIAGQMLTGRQGAGVDEACLADGGMGPGNGSDFTRSQGARDPLGDSPAIRTDAPELRRRTRASPYAARECLRMATQARLGDVLVGVRCASP